MATATEIYSPSLAIENYRHVDDFDEWILRFELAVELAHNVTGPDNLAKRNEYCLKWLPVKIDEATWTLYRGITSRDWDTVKKELSTHLEDPQERYDWFAGRNPIIWDGKESFHSLAMRIKLKVDKYIEEASRPRENFQRFRGALTKEYKKAIDLGCGDKWDVEEAKRIATRLRIAEGNASAVAQDEPEPRSFAGAAMKDDHYSSARPTREPSRIANRRPHDHSYDRHWSHGSDRDQRSTRHERHPSRSGYRRSDRHYAFDDRDDSPEYRRYDRERDDPDRDMRADPHDDYDDERWNTREQRGCRNYQDYRDRDREQNHGRHDRDHWQGRRQRDHDEDDRYARLGGDAPDRFSAGRQHARQGGNNSTSVNQLADAMGRLMRRN